MKTKLTLNINEEKIKKIKSFAKANGISVSKFVEQRIDFVTSFEPAKKLNISTLQGTFRKAPKNLIKTKKVIKKD